MYVCMYVCMYVSMYVCMYVCTCSLYPRLLLELRLSTLNNMPSTFPIAYIDTETILTMFRVAISRQRKQLITNVYCDSASSFLNIYRRISQASNQEQSRPPAIAFNSVTRYIYSHIVSCASLTTDVSVQEHFPAITR